MRFPSPLTPLPAAVLIAAVLAACGGHGGRVLPSHRQTTSSRSLSSGSTARGQPSAGSASGATLFAQDCQACHSLIGNESLRTQGGDLLRYRMPRADLVSFTRVMPVHPRMTRAQIDAVVDYILRAQRSGSIRIGR